MKAAGWAVLDAEDRVLTLELSRVVAHDVADRIDGARVAPLTVADLDDIDPNAPAGREDGRR